jgi:hypothetical protein
VGIALNEPTPVQAREEEKGPNIFHELVNYKPTEKIDTFLLPDYNPGS